MDGLFWRSSTWRWAVTKSRSSGGFFAAFSLSLVGGCSAAALALQSLTNPGSVELSSQPEGNGKAKAQGKKEEELLRSGRPDAAMIGQVNKQRLGQMLEEIRNKENTEDRYVAALRGETLLGTPQARHLASGSTVAHGAGMKSSTSVQGSKQTAGAATS